MKKNFKPNLPTKKRRKRNEEDQKSHPQLFADLHKKNLRIARQFARFFQKKACRL